MSPVLDWGCQERVQGKASGNCHLDSRGGETE